MSQTFLEELVMLAPRRAFTLLELTVAFIIIATISVIAVPSLIVVISNAQTDTNASVALDIANQVYATNHATVPMGKATASQYESQAQASSASTITGVTSIENGAEFYFQSGSGVCVTTPAATSASPALISCPS